MGLFMMGFILEAQTATKEELGELRRNVKSLFEGQKSSGDRQDRS